MLFYVEAAAKSGDHFMSAFQLLAVDVRFARQSPFDYILLSVIRKHLFLL